MPRTRRLPVRLLVPALVAAAAAVLAAQPVPPSTVSLLVSAGTVVTMDGDRRILAPGVVAVDEGRIVAVGAPEDVGRRFEGEEVVEAGDDVVLPGLVNTHTHAPMVLYRGLADDLALTEWLERYIFPAEARTVSPAFVRAGMRLAALEMIRSGTTAFADMYYFEDDIAEVAREAGLRGVFGQSVIQFPVADAKTPAEALARAEALIRRWRGDPLVVPAVAPHSMYTLDAEALKASRDLARRYDVPLLIHLAETEEEVRLAHERHGRSPTGYLETLRFLGPGTVAAHGVWVSDEDIDILKRRQVGIAHNPESNMKLASGTAPVPAYLEAGVAVGLGTDGAASNNDLDMFEAMRQAALVHKLVTGDPRAVPAAQALEMATLGGARVLGLDRLTGSIEPGKRADLIVVSMDAARQTPLYDPISHLVYVTRGDDVRTTIVGGRILMRDGRVLTLDESAVLAEARKMADEVRAAVKR